MSNVCRHCQIPCWWRCLSTLQMVLCFDVSTKYAHDCSAQISGLWWYPKSNHPWGDDESVHDVKSETDRWQTDRPRYIIYRCNFMFYHSFNWPYEGQRSPSRMFVEDRNLLPRKSLPRRIQAVNRGDLGFTKNSMSTWWVQALMGAHRLRHPDHSARALCHNDRNCRHLIDEIHHVAVMLCSTLQNFTAQIWS